jgi:hypothetical protein
MSISPPPSAARLQTTSILGSEEWLQRATVENANWLSQGYRQRDVQREFIRLVDEATLVTRVSWK